MTTETPSLREDLEALYEYVKTGWMGRESNGKDSRWVPHGDSSHGCLMGGICTVLLQPAVRVSRMVEALGFDTSNDLYMWNDVQGREWESVLQLVKEAVGKA